MAAPATDRRLRPAWVVTTSAAISLLGHLWMLAAHAHGPLLTGLMVGMTLWCGWCAAKVVLRPTSHCLYRLLMISLAMAAVHTAMIVVSGQPGAGGHALHHTAEASISGASVTAAGDHVSATLAIIAVEFLVAAVCAVELRRRRSFSAPVRTTKNECLPT